jgi:hypothetical protein
VARHTIAPAATASSAIQPRVTIAAPHPFSPAPPMTSDTDNSPPTVTGSSDSTPGFTGSTDSAGVSQPSAHWARTRHRIKLARKLSRLATSVPVAPGGRP